MGLLSSTNISVKQDPNYPQEINHHYETPPQVIKQVDEWRDKILETWKEQQLTNNFIETKCWTHFDFISGKHILAVSAKINGKVDNFEIEVGQYELKRGLSNKTLEGLREGIANMIVKPLAEELLHKMQVDGVLDFDR